MKLLARLKASASALVAPVAKSGANGLFVSRKVLNAQEWFDWAKAAGVPNPIAAADMHVTVISSTTDAKIPLECCSFPISTMSGYWESGCFGFLGKDDSAFAFMFSCWNLSDRFYAYQGAGAVPIWPNFIPHLSLSMDAAGFDLPDAALANVPAYILLGPEVRQDLKQPDASDVPDADDAIQADDLDDDGDDGDTFIIIVELSQKAAADTIAKAKAKEIALEPFQIATLDAMAHGKAVTKAAARYIAKATWAPDLLKTVEAKTDERGLAPPSAEKKSKDATIMVKQLSAEIAKKFGPDSSVSKTFNEERRWVYGIASVSTVGGELVDDLDGDFATTQFLEEYLAKSILEQAGGDFEHEGETVNQLVGGLVFSSDIQKVLGIDLGMEFLLTVTHVPDDANWEMVKEGNWMHSIAGTFYYED